MGQSKHQLSFNIYKVTKEHQIRTTSRLEGWRKQFTTRVNQVKPPLGKLLGHICDQQELTKMIVNKLRPHREEFYQSKTEDTGLGACHLLVTKKSPRTDAQVSVPDL